MAINSKVELCNMAQSHLGNLGTINDIDVPITPGESIFSLWYDICRQDLLKTIIPNFAMARRVVSKSNTAPTFSKFGYSYAYEYPNDCLKLLGIGDVDLKENTYSVEGGYIYSDDDYEDGMPIRFILDVIDVNMMSPEFKTLLAVALADKVCMPLTQDFAKKKIMIEMLSTEMSRVSGINAQENRPVRISNSRFRAARSGIINPTFQNKK